MTVLASILAAGCAGTGQQGVNMTGASQDVYANEFYLGYDHHITARDHFNNATSLWDLGDYSNASGYLAQAGDECTRAQAHYHNMIEYAGTDDERAFAQGMEEAAASMDEATAKYLDSIGAAALGNVNESNAYFDEGQALVDSSMASIKRSLEIMPPWLEG